VWAFLKQHPGLRSDGHNLFLYHQPSSRQAAMDVDFGVQVIGPFERSGEVFMTQTPAGKVATALPIGSYDGMGEAHDAIQTWASEQEMSLAGKSWEIYGDWTEQTRKLETRIEYLLA
jgi:effector-binding domain-containing protein